MNKKVVKMAPVGAKPSEEERLRRAVAQARIEYFQGLLYNAVSSGSGLLINGEGKPDFKPIIEAAWEGSLVIIEKLFNQAEQDEAKKEGE